MKPMLVMVLMVLMKVRMIMMMVVGMILIFDNWHFDENDNEGDDY